MENRKKAGKSRKKQEKAIMRKKWNPGIRVFAGVVLTAAILSGCGSKTAGSGSAQNGGQNTEQNTMQDTTAQGNSDSQKV